MWLRRGCVSLSLVRLHHYLWLLYIQVSLDFRYEKERFRQFVKFVHIFNVFEKMFCLRRTLFVKKKKLNVIKNYHTQSKKPRWFHGVEILQNLQIPYHTKATYIFTEFRKWHNFLNLFVWSNCNIDSKAL